MPNNREFHVRQRDEHEAVISVGEAVGDFLASPEVKALRPKTQEEYMYNLNAFATWCSEHSLQPHRNHRTFTALPLSTLYGPIDLHQVNHHVVTLFLEHLTETHKPSKKGNTKLSDSTYAQYVKDIKRLLHWCVMDDLYTLHVNSNTVERIKKPPIAEFVIETFKDEQIDALFAACKKEFNEHLQVRDDAILCLFLDSGIRVSELTNLTVGNTCLDPKDAHIKVYGKGGRWGEVGIGEKARRSLQKYIRVFRTPTIEERLKKKDRRNITPHQQQQEDQRERDGSFVFVGRTGEKLTRAGVTRIIVRLGDWAHIHGVRCSPHTFRHTYAKRLYIETKDVYAVSRALRHKSVKVTEAYLKSLSQSEMRQDQPSVLDTRSRKKYQQ